MNFPKFPTSAEQNTYPQPRQYSSFNPHDGAGEFHTRHQSPINPLYSVEKQPSFPQTQEYPTFIQGATLAAQIGQGFRCSNFHSDISPRTFEQRPWHSFNVTSYYSDTGTIDPHLLEPFKQYNLNKNTPPQNLVHNNEAPEIPIRLTEPEKEIEVPARSSKAFCSLSGYLGQLNKDGCLDCFKDCERHRYNKHGFSRRSNLLAHLRSCHRQDIPRNDHVRAHKKEQRLSGLGRGGG